MARLPTGIVDDVPQAVDFVIAHGDRVWGSSAALARPNSPHPAEWP
jgi:hypothetical protein